MKLPISWLKDYVEVDATPEAIADRLTFSGTEIEGIEQVGSTYDGVVVGEVLSIDPHPNADRLRLCRVGNGTDAVPVVCGADNFAVGDKAALATPGATLAGGITLRRTKIRGEVSEGMLCAEDELGLFDDHSGILVLDRSIAAGTPLVEILGGPETVLDVEITWNRPDCLSIIGMAREVAALFGCRLKRPPVEYSETGDPVEDAIRVQIDAPDGCPRYTARTLTDVSIGPSPMWVQRRLRLCGVRPINNVVDITNYVLLETGHPLHAFDAALLDGSQIIVRCAREGETMETLDGATRTLTPDMLVIADAQRAVALAGVMGGADSEIRDTTRRVLLESACFDPATIRHTSATLSLSTESSHRFERGVDIGGVEWASRRAASLVVELAGATASRGVVDVYPGACEPRRVRCRTRRICDVLGMQVSTAQAVAVLKSLELPVVVEDADGCEVDVPTFRRDLVIEADLIEEVVRMVGLDEVPALPPQAVIVPGADDRATRARQACRRALQGLGVCEIANYSFVSRRLLETVQAGEAERWVELPNPVSVDHAIMRPCLAAQMIETLGRNRSRENTEACLYEMGRVFRLDGEAVQEPERLCIGLMGPLQRAAFDRRRPVEAVEMYRWTRGLVEALCVAQGVTDMEIVAAAVPGLDPAASARVLVGGAEAGVLGLVADAVRHGWRLTDAIGIAELAAEPFLGRVFDTPATEPLAAYPAVTCDVAVVVDESVRHADIEKIIRRNAPGELTAIELFDIFRSEGIGGGRKSMAYSLRYRSLERTLTHADANAYHDVIKAALRNELNCEIRES